MKKFIATYWRYNCQLANGGYETTRTIEARTLASAERIAQKSTECVYGHMSLLNVEPA